MEFAPLERCQRALTASNDSFWECHLPTGEVWHSPRFLALMGDQPLHGTDVTDICPDLVHPDERALVALALKLALAQQGHFDFEARLHIAGGGWRWQRGRGQVWLDGQGHPEYLTGALIDIHPEVLARQSLEQQQQALESTVRERTAALASALALAEQRQQEAERADAAKTSFLARMSHEVRTPLSGVLGVTELALRTPLTSEQRRYLESAHQSGQVLMRLLDNVLDLSRIESGHVDLQDAPFDPASMVADVLRGLMPLCQRPEVLLRFDWDGESPWVLGDENCLRQILTNLLGNAIKFTSQGHVTLQGQASRQADDRVALHITVSDTGPGIPDHLRAAVFEPYVQADRRLSPSQGGVGLGLAITSRLAQAMQAELTLSCPPSGGSVFALTLCLPKAEQAGVATRADGPSSGPFNAQSQGPGRVWLVYQDLPSGQWLANRLQRLGWRTQVVPGVDAAVALAHADPEDAPDVLLLSGTALRGVNDLQPLRQALPMAVMRLLVRPNWHEPALESQASELDFETLVAPLTPDQLQQLGSGRDLPFRAGNSRLRAAGVDKPALPGAGAGTIATEKPADAGAPLRTGVLLVEDNPVNQLVSQEYLRTLGLEVRLAETGEAAMAACLKFSPQLVLMDLELPGMDGLQATRQLRALQRSGNWAGAPIVALTAHASAAHRAACRAAGMDGVLTKPLSLNTLRKRLSRWLVI